MKDIEIKLSKKEFKEIKRIAKRLNKNYKQLIVDLIKKSLPNRSKKYKVFLIRHGESEANKDHRVYMTVPDHKIKLTEKGYKQALKLGKSLKKIIKNKPLDVYISPYMRTRETWNGVQEGLNRFDLKAKRDPCLREQQHKIFKSDKQRKKVMEEKKKFSVFYYRFGSGGESTADVFERISTFWNELRLDRKVFNHQHDCLIVAHNIVLQSILFKIFDLDEQLFEEVPDLENCKAIVLETEDFNNFSINYELTMGNKKLLKFLN